MAVLVTKVIKGLKVADGKFSYTSSPAFNPSDCKIIDNIKADRKLVWNEEKDASGRTIRISGSVG